MLAAMLRRAAIGLVTAAILVVAVPSGSAMSTWSAASDRLPTNLRAALDEIEYAIDHEEEAGDALDEAGARVDDYAAGHIDDAIDHLGQALDDLASAVAAGEITRAEADGIADMILEARGHDDDALDTIDGAASVRSTLRDLTDALEDKEDAGDWIYYGDDYDWADLGCVLNVAFLAGDVAVGYDGCKVAVSELVLRFGFPFARYSYGVVGEGNTQISQVPCTVVLWTLDCRPPQPLVPPNQYIFAAVGPASTVMTDNWAIAVGTNGKAQRSRFRVGTVQATDLGLRASLRDLTPYGLVATDGSTAAPRLGAGIGYVYEVEVANQGLGTALDAVVDIDVPAGFAIKRMSPRSCGRSGLKVRCPLGALQSDYVGLVGIWGEPATPGAATFRAAVSSGATEPSPDPGANAASTSAKVYGVPRTSIGGMSSSILAGRRGTITGTARPGAAFEPSLERVAKVEIALLRSNARAGSATKKTCLWLNRTGGFTPVPAHRGGCDKGIWLPATGTTAWTFALRKGLPRGTYDLLARGTNAAGITTRTFGGALKNRATFSVK